MDVVQVVEIHAPAQVISDVVGVDQSGIVEVTTRPAALVVVDASASQVIEVITSGPQGPTGATGQQGQQGQAGPSASFTQDFADASDVWVITHPLGGHPVVTTMDLNGDEITGDVTYPDNATVVITWGMPFAGRAVLSG